jgi:hypothetical protein
MDEARRIASNIAKLPMLLERKDGCSLQAVPCNWGSRYQTASTTKGYGPSQLSDPRRVGPRTYSNWRKPMKTKLTVATALAGTLLATFLVSGSAQATPLPVLKGDATPGNVTLVGKGGRGGGGGGGHAMRGGGGGGHAMRGGGGGYKGANRGGGGGKYAYKGGGGGYKGGGKYAYKGGDGGYKGGGKYAYKDGNKHYAMRDHDRNHGNNHNRHRVWRNGAWVWVGGYGYTAYANDCYWLRRQAIITGSPYWWDRYNACVGYDYY